MNIIEQGQGFPVVFLHGWGGSVDSFAFVASNLLRSYRTVRLDFPGFGDSPAPVSCYGAEDYADEAAAALKERNITQAVFVCHSFGGRVGIMLAAKYPDLVVGLMLVDSAGIRPKLSLIKRMRVAAYKRAKRRGKTPKHAGSKDYQALPPTMQATFVRVVNEDLTEQLRLVRAPTLLVWGNKDKDTPLYMAERIKEGVNGSALVVLEGGHFSYLDAPYTFVRVLDEFLRGVVPAKQGGFK